MYMISCNTKSKTTDAINQLILISNTRFSISEVKLICLACTYDEVYRTCSLVTISFVWCSVGATRDLEPRLFI